jgi:flagellar biosynthesis protein FlhG
MKGASMELRQLAVEPSREDGEVVAQPVLVIASGKGGAGKSLVSVLMANALAEQGRRVLLFDGSQNLAHLHVLLGVSLDRRLEEVVKGDVEPAALLLEARPGLWLVPGDSGAEGLYALPAVDQARLHHRLSSLYRGFDLVILDAGSGVEGAIRLATMGGTRLVVVTVPEVAALTDAYALIKLVHAQLPQLPIDVLINRVGHPEDVEATFGRLATAAERFLGRSLSLLGGLSEAPALRAALRRPGGLLDDAGLEPFRAEAAALARIAVGASVAVDPGASP